MNDNISNNALNRLINTRFVKNEQLYQSAEYVFSTSVFMPSDMVILNNQKVYTYLTGLIHLVETFNARVNAYMPSTIFNPQNHALVIFFDKMFNEAGYYTNNAPLNINNKFTKKRLFSNTYYNSNNISDIKALFTHIKTYLNHVATSDDPIYSNIVLVEYDMNYKSALNTGIHSALHSNFNTIGMMARFLPLFDYTKLATFIINCNYALTPNYLLMAMKFIQSNCIIYPVTENYAFSDFNSPDPNYTFSVFVALFPEIMDSVRYLGGFFGIKNQIVHSMDNAMFVDIPMQEFASAKFNISRPPTSWTEITDKMANKITQTISSNIDLINPGDDPAGAPFKRFSIQERIDDFIDLIYELRDTENPHAYIDKNINIGTEYITDELFLSWVFDVFSKIFVNSGNMNFAYALPTVAEYIENSEILAQSPMDKQAAIAHATKVGIYTVSYNEYAKRKPKLTIFNYQKTYPELTPFAFKMLYSIETNSYTNTISRQLSYNIVHNTFDFHEIYKGNPYVNGLLFEIKFDDSIIDYTLAPNDKIREFLKSLRTNAYYYLSRSLFTNPAVKRSRSNEANNGFNNVHMPNTKRARAVNRRNNLSTKLTQKNNIGRQTKDPMLTNVLNYFRTKRSFCTLLSSFDMNKNMVLWSPSNSNDIIGLLQQYPDKYKFFNIHDVTIRDIIDYVHAHCIIRPY